MPTDAAPVDLAVTDQSPPDISPPDLDPPDLLAPDAAMPDLPVPDLLVPDLLVPDQLVPDLFVPDQLIPDMPWPTCTDNQTNGDETDVDCGGSSCQGCADTKKCIKDTDCLSQVCVGNLCQKPTCTDKVKNGSETDVDCGGGACPTCASSMACSNNSDCASGFCLSNLCAVAPTGSTTLTLVMTPASGGAGTTSLTVKSAAGFKAGQRVLIHQTQGSGAGAYEEAEVGAVNATGLTLTLKAALKNTYVTGTGNNRAQVMVMATHGSLVVKSGVILRAPTWDGTVGGILPLYVTGTLQLDKGGTLTMVGLGFRGYSHKGIYRNQHGWQGESEVGSGKQLTTPNGAGGSGGYQVVGKNGSGGGGGGHAGGAIYLYAPTLTMAINTLSSRGGTKGTGTESNPGGDGSVGRIRVDYTTLNSNGNGSTAAIKALQDASYPDAYGGKI